MKNLIWKFESGLIDYLFIWSILSLLSGPYSWFVKNEFGLSLHIVHVRYAVRRKSAVDPKSEALFIRKIFHAKKNSA